MRRAILLILIVAALTGCKTQQELLKKRYPNPTYRQLLELHEQWQQSIRFFKGHGRITLDTPQFSGNFEADILARGTDSLLISVSGFLGSQVGKVFVGKKRFIFYNQYQNQFLTGLNEDFETTNFMQFPLSVSELRQVFLARDRFNILKKVRFEKQDGVYYLEARNGHYDYRIWFDDSTLLIKRIEYWREGEMLFFKQYKNFVVKNGFYFPLVINFVRPQLSEGMSIIFNKVEINQPIPDEAFHIKVSDSARQLIIPSNKS